MFDRPGDSAVGFQLLIHLSDMLGVLSLDTHLHEERLKVLGTLLCTTVDLDVYQAASDYNCGGKQLAWLHKLVDWLLQNNNRCRRIRYFCCT